MPNANDSKDARSIVFEWLGIYNDTLCSLDSLAVANTFLYDGWLRDVLTFSWDLRALEGRDKISQHTSPTN